MTTRSGPSSSANNNDGNSNKAGSGGSGSFECNICFDTPTDPVVTQCGHLYCWRCLTTWLDRKPDCPVCKGAVVRDECIPLYGRGRQSGDDTRPPPPRSHQGQQNNDDGHAAPPPRPQGHRRDPLPQQNLFNGFPGGGALFPGMGSFGLFFLPSLSWLPLMLVLYFIQNHLGGGRGGLGGLIDRCDRGIVAIGFGCFVLFSLLFLEI